MPQLSHRVGTFTDSVIRRMTRICYETEGSINLSQGFPDFDPPQEILDALKANAVGGMQHQYPIPYGTLPLRKCIAETYSKRFGRELDPENEVIVTCGSTEAMVSVMMTICNPGDKVILFSPFYENYNADMIISGAQPIFVPLVPPSFAFDPAVLEAAFQQHPKAILICNPSNPCGKVFTRDELALILHLAEKYDAFVVTDEVYEHIVFAPNVHVHAASLPGGFERTITCNSLSKTFSITGWRLGFIIAPKWVVDNAKKFHDFLTAGSAGPLQESACAGFRMGEDYYRWFNEMYTRKRDLFVRGLDEIGIKHTVPQGSYFIMVDISDFLAKPQFAGWTDMQFCEWMIREVGVAAVPGSSFFREPVNHLIRLHFARREEVLEEALKRLAKLKKYL